MSSVTNTPPSNGVPSGPLVDGWMDGCHGDYTELKLFSG